MKNYVKPVVLDNEEIFEGVYAASGGPGEDCYTASAYIHQTPETGRHDYRVQVNGVHSTSDGHHGTAQVLELTFNLPVEFKSCSEGSLASGDGTNTIRINLSYHQNGSDNIGLGDVYVTADEGLADPQAVIYCNYTCEHNQ